MPYATLMRIINTKGTLNEADPVSRRPDFLRILNLSMPNDSLWWDEKVSNINTNGNGLALLVLSTLEALSVDDDFLSNLKGAYSTCAYFSNDSSERRLMQKIYKSYDGCNRHLPQLNDRTMISLGTMVMVMLIYQYSQ